MEALYAFGVGAAAATGVLLTGKLVYIITRSRRIVPQLPASSIKGFTYVDDIRMTLSDPRPYDEIVRLSDGTLVGHKGDTAYRVSEDVLRQQATCPTLSLHK